MGKPVFDPNLYDELKSDSEQLTLARHVAYLHAPDGIGRSRLAPAIERVLGCPATGRNLRTAREIAALLT